MNKYNGKVTIEDGQITEIDIQGSEPLADFQRMILLKNMVDKYLINYEKHYDRNKPSSSPKCPIQNKFGAYD